MPRPPIGIAEAPVSHCSRSIGVARSPDGQLPRAKCGVVLTRAGVGVDDGDTLLAGLVLEEALLGAVVAGARQAGEVEENGDLLRHLLCREGLRGQVEVQRHLAVGRLRLVGELQKLAAKRGDGRSRGEGHCVVCFEPNQVSRNERGYQ